MNYDEAHCSSCSSTSERALPEGSDEPSDWGFDQHILDEENSWFRAEITTCFLQIKQSLIECSEILYIFTFDCRLYHEKILNSSRKSRYVNYMNYVPRFFQQMLEQLFDFSRRCSPLVALHKWTWRARRQRHMVEFG